MTIWIDPPAWPAHGRLWSHLISDRSYAELHEFAAAQGVPRRAFEGDHYDVPQERHAQLVAAGAQPVGGGELVRILRASGLRIQKRTRERVVVSRGDVAELPPGSRVDVIASRQDTAPASTVSVRLGVLRRDGLLVVTGPDGELDLPSSVVGDRGAAGALDDLRTRVLGHLPLEPARLTGYVRYWVAAADHDYPWPRPAACFAVYRESAVAGAGTTAGRWLSWTTARTELGDRHWWPLVADPEAGDPR